MKILNELYTYAKSPYYIYGTQSPKRKHIIDLLILFSLSYLVKIIWIITVSKWIKKTFAITQSSISDNQNTPSGIIEIFFIGVIAAPIIEEYIFRYFLKWKKNIALILGVIIVTTGPYWIIKQFHLPDLTKKIISVAVILILNGLLIMFYVFRNRTSNSLASTYIRYFPVFFYLSMIMFALVHVANFSAGNNYLVLPLLIVPQLLSGLIYGFARMKFGMWANLSLHISANLLTFILDVIFKI